MRRRTRAALLSVSIVLVLGVAAGLWWWNVRTRRPVLEPGWAAVVMTVAGDGVRGHRDGTRTEARFSDPFGVVAAPDGSIYIADAGESQSIRRLSTDGSVTTLAGGSRGFADGFARSAQFNTPSGLAMGADGTLYVADTGNDAIRRVTPEGVVSTVVGPGAGLNGPLGVAVHPDGRLIVADTYNDRIVVVRPPYFALEPYDGFFDTPSDVAVDAEGRIHVAELGSGAVRRLSRDGISAPIAAAVGGGWLRPVALTVGDGSLFVTDDRGRILEITEEGGMRLVAGSTSGFAEGVGSDARFRSPSGIAFVAPGHLIVTDRRNALVRRVSARGWLDLSPPAPPLDPRFDRDWFARKPLLWPFFPFEGPFEVTGTLGEPRGTTSERLHSGLDIQSPEGVPVHIVRAATVDHPLATFDFDTLNESIRVGPVAYIHLRVGRDRRNRPFDDPRFVFAYDDRGRVVRVRVKRGASFEMGEPIGTVNRFYHAHLNVGWPGEERNPLQFRLVNFVDTVPPVISGIHVYTEENELLKQRLKGRLLVSGRVRIVVDAWDQVDGNLARRRLGLYRLGYQLLHADGSPVEEFGELRETLRFDRHPGESSAAGVVYATGSGIPVYGARRTRFLYLVTSTLRDGVAADGLFDAGTVPAGNYVLRILAADASGNEAVRNTDLPITIAAPVSDGLGERGVGGR